MYTHTFKQDSWGPRKRKGEKEPVTAIKRL